MAQSTSTETIISAVNSWNSSLQPPSDHSSLADGVHSSKIALHSSFLYFISNAGSIVAVNLQPNPSSSKSTLKELRFWPLLDFNPQSILINEDGNRLAIAGTSKLAVCKLTNVEQEGEILNPHCRLTYLKVTADPSVTIRKVLWHPLSSSHLVVMTSDSKLQVWNLKSSDNQPEQEFQLVIPQKSTKSKLRGEEYERDSAIMNFCFGEAGPDSGWQLFTVFLLSASGHIYFLCPVVPYGCRIPNRILNDLKNWIQVQLSKISNTANLQLSLPNLAADQKKYLLNSQLQWITNVCSNAKASNKFATSVISEESQTEDILVAPSPSLGYEPQLQGPIATSAIDKPTPQMYILSSPSVKVHDLFIVSPSPTIFARTHSSGHVELLLQTENHFQPSWKLPNASIKPALPEVTLIAGIDLSLASGPSNLSSSSSTPKKVLISTLEEHTKKESQKPLPTPPTLLRSLCPGPNSSTPHTTFKPSFLLYSSCGIVQVTIPWISSLAAMLNSMGKNVDDENQSLLPPTSLRILLNCAPIGLDLPSIHGACTSFLSKADVVGTGMGFVLVSPASSPNTHSIVSFPITHTYSEIVGKFANLTSIDETSNLAAQQQQLAALIYQNKNSVSLTVPSSQLSNTPISSLLINNTNVNGSVTANNLALAAQLGVPAVSKKRHDPHEGSSHEDNDYYDEDDDVEEWVLEDEEEELEHISAGISDNRRLAESLSQLKLPERLGPSVFAKKGSNSLDIDENNQLYIYLSEQFNECYDCLKPRMDNMVARMEHVSYRAAAKDSLLQSLTHSLEHISNSESDAELRQRLESTKAAHQAQLDRLSAVKSKVTNKLVDANLNSNEFDYAQDLKRIEQTLSDHTQTLNQIAGIVAELESAKPVSYSRIPPSQLAPFQATIKEQEEAIQTMTAELKALLSEIRT